MIIGNLILMVIVFWVFSMIGGIILGKLLWRPPVK